jgi:hypothetical protein
MKYLSCSEEKSTESESGARCIHDALYLKFQWPHSKIKTTEFIPIFTVCSDIFVVTLSYLTT